MYDHITSLLWNQVTKRISLVFSYLIWAQLTEEDRGRKFKSVETVVHVCCHSQARPFSLTGQSVSQTVSLAALLSTYSRSSWRWRNRSFRWACSARRCQTPPRWGWWTWNTVTWCSGTEMTRNWKRRRRGTPKNCIPEIRWATEHSFSIVWVGRGALLLHQGLEILPSKCALRGE